MNIPSELIVGAFVLLIGAIGLVLMKAWLIKNLGAEGYKRMSIFSSDERYAQGDPDPLAEAEVLIAYGRKKQALELLEKVLQENPFRTDVETRIRELKEL